MMNKRQRERVPGPEPGDAQKRRPARQPPETAAPTDRRLEEYRAHKERVTFSETLQSREVCAASGPTEHVPRPPTVVWDPEETMALLQLGGGPERGGMPTAQRSFNVANGPWYAEPYLDQAVKRGALGYGSLHSQPVVKARGKRSVVKDALSPTQAQVLQGQNTGGQNFVVRVMAILREGRARPYWTMEEFLSEVGRECGERLVHVSCMGKEEEGVAVTLGYSIDQGGRYFIALRWTGIAWPAATGERPKWTDLQFHPVRQRPTLTRYTCQCVM